MFEINTVSTVNVNTLYWFETANVNVTTLYWLGTVNVDIIVHCQGEAAEVNSWLIHLSST